MPETRPPAEREARIREKLLARTQRIKADLARLPADVRQDRRTEIENYLSAVHRWETGSAGAPFPEEPRFLIDRNRWTRR